MPPKLRMPNIAAAPAKLAELSAAAHGDGDGALLEALLRGLLQTPTLETVFYIEIGVVHPTRASSYVLYQHHHARGALIEANPERIEALRAARPDDEIMHAALSFGTHPALAQDGTADLPLATLLEAVSQRTLHYLAINVDGLGGRVLPNIDWALCRPWVISSCSALGANAVADQSLSAAMAQHGYRLAARSNGNLVFVDGALSPLPAALPLSTLMPIALNTFDVFDTLIARRCIEPHGIHDRVEQLSGVSGYKALRVQAERNVEHGAHSVEAIFAELVRMTGMSAADGATLLQLELAEERANAILIHDNYARVKDGDLLLSDMYLSKAQIFSLLDAAGYARETYLYVSNGDKANGSLWPRVKQQFQISCHLGDNRHSDIAQASQHAVPAEYTGLHQPTQIEATLRSIGCDLLAKLLREARLTMPAHSHIERELRKGQFWYNLPILLLSAVHLAQLAQTHGYQKILFSSRDCYLWLKLIKRLGLFGEGGPEIAYFYTNRRLRKSGDPVYLAYVAQCMRARTLVVDTCGTGWSLAHLQDQVQQPFDVFLIHYLGSASAASYYSAYPQARSTRQPHSLVERSMRTVPFECLNYADHGTVAQMRQGLDSEFIPLFEANDYPADLRRAVQYNHACVDHFITLLDHYDVAALLAQGQPDMLAPMVTKLYELLAADDPFYGVFKAYHEQDDHKNMVDLHGGV